ncbi:MAG: alpha-glucan family phosphorylase [Acidobacteriaceae bacterium]
MQDQPDAVDALSPAFHFLSGHTVAYFSMEIALSPEMPTYSGGLGVLAGDTLRSAADMGVPIIAVTLLHRKGYFRQRLDENGQQTEESVPWNPEAVLQPMEQVVAITVQNRPVMVRAWRYDLKGVAGHVVPVFLLDTDLEPNDPWDRRLTDHLYGGDTYYRLCQETILGIGGARILAALGYRPEVFHMNEGHASLLTIGLLEEQMNGAPLLSAQPEDIEAVRSQCVFTTHTPVPAGHDKFGVDQMYQILGEDYAKALEHFGCMHDGLLNMTYIALRFSRYVNGVAMQHGKVSQEMFPEYAVKSITNGVHAATWTSQSFQKLFDEHLPEWRYDNNYLHNALGISLEEIVACHRESKQLLLQTVAERTGVQLREDVLTLGFARRVATYKRADLLFHNPERLVRIAHDAGGLQILYGGKAHPQDAAGKGLIRNVFEAAKKLNSDAIRIVYLENYEWELGALLTNGVDVWVNTPRRPYEASGTSGMKAALNGVPSLSVLDGWWIEGCIENATGWAIEDHNEDESESASLYDKLERTVAPLYYKHPEQWARIMQVCIAINGSFFNTNRMLEQYVGNAYFPEQHQRMRVKAPEPVLI